VRAWAMPSLVVVLTACLPVEPTRPTPVIEAVVPPAAASGQHVVITGRDFGSDRARGEITLGGTPAPVHEDHWTETECHWLVPEVPPADYPLVVTVDGVASDPAPFTVSAAPIPSIAAIDPASAAAGETVTVSGSAFGAARRPGDTVVFAQGVDADPGVTSWSDTEIRVTVPAGAITGGVVVRAAGVASAPFPFTVAGSGPTLTQIQAEIFTPTCAQSACHDSQARGGLVLQAGRSYANLVNVASSQRPALKRVLPGDAAKSYLYQKISLPTPPEGDRMPQGLPPLGAAQIRLVRDWIEAGAPND